ncbi:chromosome partitioning protein ParA (plasmid) [Borrelia turicatae]|uniref:Chromosome partitioning protein ParA n=1 Tax=Borrelia turicatae TaxID=142 RepID=A0A172XCX6_BORTU|nr:ParA family protein [Borrelia turicatae]ANF34510.1 chromosome partitioning protein ParA [Borrelia turicatae]UPA15616.1 ParA family protein [Borrelia turicatae]
MDTKKPKVITIASIKGGVGKSTSSIILATLLVQKCKVLLIDMDTQASTTSYFYEKIEKLNINLTKFNIYEILKESIDIESSIINIDNNLDLIPSYLTLHNFNEEKIECKDILLKTSLGTLCFEYDYIVIDTNPSLDITLKNALICSDYVIVPMTAEKWAVESLDLFNFFIKKLKLTLPIFLIITRFKKNKTHKALFEILKKSDRFLGIISEREDLNRRIAENNIFDLSKDYIKEYESILENFLKKT